MERNAEVAEVAEVAERGSEVKPGWELDVEHYSENVLGSHPQKQRHL